MCLYVEPAAYLSWAGRNKALRATPLELISGFVLNEVLMVFIVRAVHSNKSLETQQNCAFLGSMK